MNAWTLIQVTIDIGLVLFLGLLWIRHIKKPKDDPRLSRGLQLLQSKIAVLEDLSDRTDVQVKQLTTLLTEKGKELQERIFQADHQINRIKESMNKSLEISEIFQDKIPHEEIMERKNTINYVKAAKMAHDGHNIDEISKEVDIPKSELEIIAKVNKDQLMFAPEELPEWAKPGMPDFVGDVEQSSEADAGESEKALREMHSMSVAFDDVGAPGESLKKMDEEFRKAVRDAIVVEDEAEESTMSQATPYIDIEEIVEPASVETEPKVEAKLEVDEKAEDPVKPYEFRRIDFTRTIG